MSNIVCFEDDGQEVCLDMTPSADQGSWSQYDPNAPPPQYTPPQDPGCPSGLILTSNPGYWDYSIGDEPTWVGGSDTCECPSYGCIAENQSLPSPPGGCPAPSCCPPATPVNGICKNPPGYGTYVSGPLPVTLKVSGCDGSPGLVVGKQSDCPKPTVFDKHKWRAYYVDGQIPNQSLCPQIGSLSKAQWVDNNNNTGFATGEFGIGDKVRLQCTYSLLNNPFDSLSINAFTGPGATNLTKIQKSWCDAKNYAGLKDSSDCATYYRNNTRDYDLQQVMRIQNENPNGEWINNSDYLTVVQQVATGSASAGSSSLGKQTAQNMIANYCLVQNPRGWADNDTVRAIINSWALQNAANIGDDCQLVAVGIIKSFCQANPTSSHCDCYNATQFGTNIFNACQGNTTGACSDINKLAASFSEAPDIFKPQVEAIKSYITPNCAVGACVSAALNLSSSYLAPSTLTSLKCESDIQVCLQSVEVGGSIAPGATINQSCKNIIRAAGGTVGDTVPDDNRGFTNVQAVQANTNAPGGGTLAAVTSPGGSSTQVGTTGTSGGGLQQTITSSTPVGIGSTGGPVSYTSPAPAPSPTTINFQTATPEQKTAIAVGGGLLGLSSSCLFFIFIIVIIMMIFGGKGKTAAPPVIPLAAYGL